MNSLKRARWRASVGAALAAAALIPLTMSGPAFAAPTIDPDALGSITVHKYETPDSPTGLPNDGTEQSPTGLVPMADVEFTVQQVDPATYDLTTNAGWAVLEALTPATAAGGPFGTQTTITTGADGSAVAASLPVGVYLVTETSYPSGVTPSAPFLVTVPLTDPNNLNNWLYDVHVYPKNATAGLTKTVADADDVAVGEEIDYTILADIPNVDVIDGYKIVDPLDARLGYVSAEVALEDGTPLAATDYTIAHDTMTNEVTVEFTAAGRAALAANQLTSVVVKITAEVLDIGEIVNTAILYPNLSSYTIEPGQPGGGVVAPGVESRWGNVTLIKVDSTDASVALEGATFKVFLSEADARDGINAVTIGGVSEWTTDASGSLTISGLRFSDWANGAEVLPGVPEFQSYWISEVAAPDGYELLAEPIEVVVVDTDTLIDLAVENVPSNGGFTLPLTGGPGTAILIGAGALLVAGAVLLTIRGRRSQNAVQA